MEYSDTWNRCLYCLNSHFVRSYYQLSSSPSLQEVGYAIIRCGEFETIDEVVFAEKGDLQLLGARTLEGFNAVVDAKRKRLVAAGPMPAARSAQQTESVTSWDSIQ